MLQSHHSPVLVDKVVLIWFGPVNLTDDVRHLEDERQPVTPNDLGHCGVEELYGGGGRGAWLGQAACTAGKALTRLDSGMNMMGMANRSRQWETFPAKNMAHCVQDGLANRMEAVGAGG